MKEISLYLVRRNYGYGDYGSWRLVMIDENEDIEEELAKKDNIKVEDYEEDLNVDLSLKIMMRYDIKEIDADRLASLVR